MERSNMAAVGLKKTDGFSLHSCHDHIKIHVCGVLKRSGIMFKNTRLQRNEHQSDDNRSLGNVYMHLDSD